MFLQTLGGDLCSLMLLILGYGTGLTLGPDSDGLLNFCDPSDAATAVQRAVNAGKAKAVESSTADQVPHPLLNQPLYSICLPCWAWGECDFQRCMGRDANVRNLPHWCTLT
jgi:hypothetical protein